MSELNKIALKIISNGKGILAADESNRTMTNRLDAVNVASTPENRLLFREMLFSSEAMKECIGGVILYDETIKQTSSFGKSIPDLISSKGSVVGGGDTVSLVNSLKAFNSFNFVSTAGGAFLEYLEGKQLPGITALNSYVRT